MSLETLSQAVQFNCDLSDRDFAADYSICIYLIRMREYYRWAQGLAHDQTLDQGELMDWVSEKEAVWEGLDAQQLMPIEYQGVQYSCFDVAGINRRLHPAGYTYSAGYGPFSKPVFMLAELTEIEVSEDYRLILAGRELARELTAPPAVMRDGEILIRTESVSRMIWDLLEEWQWHKPDNAMAELVKCFDFEGQPLEALQLASEELREVLILHEVGELIAGSQLADNWDEMLADADRHLQMFARAVRDNLADCLSTLPALISQHNIAGIHFYFASLTPLRKAMFPQLEFAYQRWRRAQRLDGLQAAVICGQDHWQATATQLSDVYSSSEPGRGRQLQAYVEQYVL